MTRLFMFSARLWSLTSKCFFSVASTTTLIDPLPSIQMTNKTQCSQIKLSRKTIFLFINNFTRNYFVVLNIVIMFTHVMNSISSVGELHNDDQERLKSLCQSFRPPKGLTAMTKPSAGHLFVKKKNYIITIYKLIHMLQDEWIFMKITALIVNTKFIIHQYYIKLRFSVPRNNFSNLSYFVLVDDVVFRMR